VKKLKWFIWLFILVCALPFFPAVADGPEGGSKVTTASDAALSKLAPELRALAREGGEEEVAFVTVLMQAETRWRPYLRNALARKPLGDLQWVSGEARGADLAKLAGLPGVVSVISPQSYAPEPAPDPEDLRSGKDYVPPPLELGMELTDLAAKKGALRKLTAGMTPDQVREKLRTDPAFRAEFVRVFGELPTMPDRPATPGAASRRGVQPETVHVKDIHHAPEAWAKGFTGSGVVAAVVDSGVDFGHPDLIGTWATVPSGDYAGWPFSYNARSGFYAAQGIYQSPDDPWAYNALWHVETRPVGVLTSTGITATADLVVDQYYGSVFTYVFSDTSQSGNYRYSVHPDPFLWVATYYLNFFWGIGYNAALDSNAILVVDENAAGVYDTVYVDLDFDLDFTDEVPLTIGNPSTSHDLDGDGVGDLSAGLLAWISDGIHPPPGTNVLFEKAPIPDQGALVAFVGDSDSHGTNCASQIAAQGVISDPLGIGPINPIFGGGATGPVLAGMAPHAKVAAFQEGYYFPYDAWTLGALGFDGLPDTGDEAQINSNSWGMSAIIDDGWDADSRFVHWLNRNYAPHMAFLMSTGNGGHGYGTVAPATGGTIIGVGASTQYGTLTYFEPITDTDQLTYGDIAPWSNRGPSALGDVDPSVVAVGAWGTGANPLNYWTFNYGGFPAPAGSFAYDYFGGTSMSTPVAVGNLALVYQAFESEHGRWPTYEEARTILMNGADDLGYDVLVQGAGNVDADRSTDIAAGLGTFMVHPPQWQAGDYRGTDYPVYPKVLFAGGSDSQTFTISNLGSAAADIAVSDAVLSRTAEVTFTVDVVTSTSAVSWFTDVTPYVNAYDPDMMRVQVVFPLEVLDTDGDYLSDDRWLLYVYDWKDLNGDGDLWEDTNGNGLVDDGEIDEEPWEYNRLSYAYPDGNYLETSVGMPKARMHDGIFMRLGRSAGSEPVTLQVRLTFYDRADWDWLSLDRSSLSVPGDGSDTFQATMRAPASARPGIYEGAIYVEGDGRETVIPVVVSMAADSPTFSFGAQSLTEPVGDLPYDNGHLFGGVDWAWRYEVGDWRFFYFDVPEGTAGDGSAMIVDTQWVNEEMPSLSPTDVDTWVYSAAADDYSTNDPAFFGPQSVEWMGGSDDYAGGGVFYFGTNTGGPREIVGAGLRDGLGFVALHNVLYGGQQLAEPIVGNAYMVKAAPSPVEITTDSTSGSATLSFTSEMSITEGITVTAYGLYQPIERTDEFITLTGSSILYYTTIDNGGLLEVSTSSGVPGLDIDLFVYWDANDDGIYETTVGSSLSPASEELVRVLLPGDGDYAFQVYGYSVPSGGASYDIRIEAAQGDEMTVSGVPGGAIAANEPVDLTLGFTHAPPLGDWYGLVFLGPASAPLALQVPYIVHFEQCAVDLSVVKYVNLSRAETGDVLTYAITVRNSSTCTETVRVEDPLPDYVVYELGSGASTQGAPFYDILNDTLSWEGELAGGESVVITFRATVSSGSGTALNRVTVTGMSSGQIVTATARTDVNLAVTYFYLPIVFRDFP
jgi:uncharacterized repeat protein (TIGR01451 family)